MQVCVEGCMWHAAGEQYDPALHEVTVPRAFFEDHVSRELVSPHSDWVIRTHGNGRQYKDLNTVKATKSTVTVRLAMCDVRDLLNDAEYYATEWKHLGNGSDYFGLGMSAKATAKRLRAWQASQEATA